MKNSCFLAQHASMEFLIENQFDFNKVIKKGITYMSQSEEAEMRKRLAPKNTDDYEKIDMSTVDQKTKQVIEDIKNRVVEWYEKSTKETYNLPSTNAYVKKLIYQEVPAMFPGGYTMSNVKGEKGFYLQLKRRTNEPSEGQYQQDVDNLVKQSVGFSQVMKLMIDSKSTLIVHNGMLDLCQMYSKFIDPLPQKLDQFKSEILKNFGKIMDTKHIVENYGQLKQLFPGTSLEECFKSIANSNLFADDVIDISLEANHKDYNCEKFHEAGYDAYLTGYILIRVAEFIGGQRDKDYKGSLDFSHLSDFDHTVWMFQSDFSLNFAIETPKQDRSFVFLVEGLTEEIKNDHLRIAFKEFGRIKIDWINGDSCYVSLEDKTKVSALKQAITQRSLKFQVRSYDDVNGIVDGIITEEENPKKRKRHDDSETGSKNSESSCVIC
jgi:poly(A)-specific ribonuclease